jgi:hypothetical protein
MVTKLVLCAVLCNLSQEEDKLLEQSMVGVREIGNNLRNDPLLRTNSLACGGCK